MDIYTQDDQNQTLEMSAHDRVKVYIRCRNCGESYILRGFKDRSGHVITGFKRCLCDNEESFDIQQIH